MDTEYKYKGGETAIQYPLKLGDEVFTEANSKALPVGEVALITRIAQASLKNARYWEAYRKLRQSGHKPQSAAIIAWKAVGHKGHGSMTQETYADLIGMSRRTLIRKLQEPATEAIAQAIQMEWLRDRIPAVDDALYQRAELGDTTAIKIFYQRARIALSGEDSEPNDNWMQALEKAKQDAETEQ